MTSLRDLTFLHLCRLVGLRLTPAQRVLSKVAFDGIDPFRLEGYESDLARIMFAGVHDVPALARRMLVLSLGRGSGKSTLAAAVTIFILLTADVSACGPGDVPAGVIIAPVKALAGICLRIARQLLANVPELNRLVESEGAEGFTLRRPDGRLVELMVLAASRGGVAARGRTILVLVMDECEFFTSADEYAITDRDVYRAIAPRLRGPAILISTPWPTPTLMREMFEANFGDPKTALAARAPSLLMRPDDAHLAATVANERVADPENAAREFDCERSAMGSTSLFLDSEALDAATDRTLVIPHEPFPGSRVGGGVDLGLAHDSAAMVLAGTLHDACTILSVQELRPQKDAPLKLSEVIAMFARTSDRYRLDRWCADAYAREPAREYTNRLGITVVSAPVEQSARAATWLALKKFVVEKRIRLPPPPCPLVAQLKTILVKAAPGGTLAITIPRRRDVGRHGDTAAACVLAVHEAAYRRSPCGVSPYPLPGFPFG